MKWDGERESQNVEDRRGMRMPGGGKGVGLGAIVIAVIVGAIFGINPLTVLGLLGGGGAMAPATSQQQQEGPPATADDTRFVRVVVASTEDVWTPLFQKAGSTYEPPKLVVFRGATPTACGTGESAMGPFYCPADRKVYLDLDFFDTLKQRLGAPGDFAQAYVIAHEVGHHVQNLLGISEKAAAAQRQGGAQGNAVSVRVELQADCFAGVWAHHSQQAKQWLETGDVEEAMNAAAQIGDDTLQRKSSGRVRPESFTHGSSAQRVEWFKRGLASGKVADCNTFASTAR